MKKRIISALLTVLMVMSLFTGLSVSAYADDENPQVVEYTLKAGDYVLKLCQAQGINYFTCKDAIIKLNGLKSENDFRFLAVGRVIKLPATDAAALNIIASGSTGTAPFYRFYRYHNGNRQRRKGQRQCRLLSDPLHDPARRDRCGHLQLSGHQLHQLCRSDQEAQQHLQLEQGRRGQDSASAFTQGSRSRHHLLSGRGA